MKDHPSQWIYSGLTCRAVTERISEYLEGRSPLGTRIRIGLHLASCTHCRTYVTQILLIRDAVAFIPGQFQSIITSPHLRQHFARCHPRHVLM